MWRQSHYVGNLLNRKVFAVVSALFGNDELASCLIYAQAFVEYAIFILWVCSFSKMLPSMNFAEDKLLV